MSDEMIVRYCSPTLAGMKTGNMFTSKFSNPLDLRDTIRRLNQTLIKKGVRVLPLRYQNGKALIYLYRPSKLSTDLKDELVCKCLSENGYGLESPERSIQNLMKRLKESDEFPHEIGFFLGYPPEDVCGFIENKAGTCKCVGCWKVYGDEEKARKTFAKYKKCTDVYCRCYAQGRSIERLTVAV